MGENMNEEYVKIPKKEWYQFIDWFTRVDELLETVARILEDIKKNLEEINRKIVAPPTITYPTPTPPTIPTPVPTPTPTPEIKFPKYFIENPEKSNGKKKNL